jgi:hypothetical protein
MPINWGKYPHDYIGAIDMLRFYRVLLIIYSCIFLVLWIDVGVKIDPLKAFFGAIAFGLSTYLIIILGVGHNAKALYCVHATGYYWFYSGISKKYILGGLVTLCGCIRN